jgi:hypothetical protein
MEGTLNKEIEKLGGVSEMIQQNGCIQLRSARFYFE